MSEGFFRLSASAGIRLLTLAVVVATTSAWGQTYTAVEIPPPQNPSSLNSDGQTAGIVQFDGLDQPFVTIDGDATFLSALHNDDQGTAVGVTVSGLAAGYSCHGAFLCTGVTWSDGGPPEAIAYRFIPRAINDAGDVVGYSQSGGEFNAPTLWRNGTLTQLPLLPDTSGKQFGGFATAVSSNGLVAGELDLATAYPYVSHAAWWDGTKVQDLGPYSSANGINSKGQVVGYLGDEAALWTNGVYTDLGSLGDFAQAMAINDDGVIVGYSNVPPYYMSAVIWINGVLHKLDDLIDPKTPIGVSLESANAINAAGQIVAFGYNMTTGEGHVYLLSPSGVTSTAAAPTFSLVQRTYPSTQTVALADATPSATIHYTIDGSTPSIQSPVYKSPLSVTRTMTIKAIGLAAGYSNSAVASATYTISKPSTAATPIDVSSVANVQAIGSLGLQKTPGLDGLDDEYASDVLGTSLIWAGVPFTFLSSDTENGVSGATIALPSGQYSAINLLGTSTRGSRNHETFVVTYADGTSANIILGMSDWAKPQSYPGESTALTMEHRVSKTGVYSHGPYQLYGYSLNLDSTKAVKSLTLPANRYVVILAGALVGKVENTKSCGRISTDSGCDALHLQ